LYWLLSRLELIRCAGHILFESRNSKVGTKALSIGQILGWSLIRYSNKRLGFFLLRIVIKIYDTDTTWDENDQQSATRKTDAGRHYRYLYLIKVSIVPACIRLPRCWLLIVFVAYVMLHNIIIMTTKMALDNDDADVPGTRCIQCLRVSNVSLRWVTSKIREV